MIHETQAAEELDQLRSRYDVLRRLGRDGPFAVYAARSRETDRHFAVKVMGHPEAGGRKPGALQVWQAHTIEPLDHPGIMVLHAVHHLQGGCVAIAMERRRGCTLAELIDAEGALPIETVERVLREIAEALAYLHQRGVVHRGVRPQSIFLDRDEDRARLCHFGIDRQDVMDRLPDGSTTPSAFAYLAPEQIRGNQQLDGRKLSRRTDLYSLGLVGYAMLAGRQPWEGGRLDQLLEQRTGEPLAPVARIRADAPAYLCAAIDRCLEPDPRRRWKSAEAFLSGLDAGSEPPPQAPSEPRLRGARRWANLRDRWVELRGPVVGSARAVRDALGRRIDTPARRKMAIAVPGVVIGLVALGAFAIGDDSPTSASGARSNPALTIREARSSGAVASGARGVAIDPDGQPGASSDRPAPPPARLGGQAAAGNATLTGRGTAAGRARSAGSFTGSSGSDAIRSNPEPRRARERSGAVGRQPAPQEETSRPEAEGRNTPGGVVLLGEPIDAESSSTLLGDVVEGDAIR